MGGSVCGWVCEGWWEEVSVVWFVRVGGRKCPGGGGGGVCLLVVFLFVLFCFCYWLVVGIF